MTERLKAAAQALVDRWDSPQWGGSAENLSHTGEYIAELRAALAEQPAEQVPAAEIEVSPCAAGGVTAQVWSVDLPVGTHKLYTAPQSAKPAEQAVVQVPPNNDLELLLRQVFAFCEATEDATEVEPKNEHQRGFDKGRRFEAKQIRRSIGDWFQAEFCGRSFMGEPVVAAALEAHQPAKRVPLADDDIDVLWAKQQTKPFKTHAEDRMAFARAVIAAYERKNGITGETA